jgi:dTMP kinase
MRRRALQIIVALILALVVTMSSGIVGWLQVRSAIIGPGVWNRLSQPSLMHDEDDRPWLWLGTRVTRAAWHFSIMPYRLAGGAPPESPVPEWSGLLSIRERLAESCIAGFPFPCFRAVTTRVDSDRVFIATATEGLDLARIHTFDIADRLNSTPGTLATTLPTHILWPRFLLNLAIYTSAIWAALCIPSAIRRIRRYLRHRRGDCLHCGYDLRDLRTCPECGLNAAPARDAPPQLNNLSTPSLPYPGTAPGRYTPGVMLSPAATSSPSPAYPWLSRLAGRFVVFEGPDGSGKTTQFRRFISACHAAALPVCEVREPGGTLVGGDVRKILLDPLHTAMSPRCEMLLYMASRAQLVDQVIKPALAQKRLVVADRFVPSTLAYQGAAGGLPAGEIEAVARVATQGVRPDLVVLFDVDEATAAARLSPLLDRMEAKGREFHRKVREGYHRQAEADPQHYAMIDATQSQEQVWEDLLSTLKARLAD